MVNLGDDCPQKIVRYPSKHRDPISLSKLISRISFSMSNVTDDFSYLQQLIDLEPAEYIYPKEEEQNKYPKLLSDKYDNSPLIFW